MVIPLADNGASTKAKQKSEEKRKSNKNHKILLLGGIWLVVSAVPTQLVLLPCLGTGL